MSTVLSEIWFENMKFFWGGNKNPKDKIYHILDNLQNLDIFINKTNVEDVVIRKYVLGGFNAMCLEVGDFRQLSVNHPLAMIGHAQKRCCKILGIPMKKMKEDKDYGF